MNLSRFVRLSMASLAMASSVSAVAEGVFISAMNTHYQLENDRDFNSNIGTTVSIGYRFNSPWAIELSNFWGDATEVATGGSADIDNLRLEALYYIWEDRFSPYAAFGVGNTTVNAIDDGFDRDTNTFNLGGGFHYHLLNNISFRGDLRFLRDYGQADNDVIVSYGLTYQFGSSEKAAEPVSLRRELDTDGDGVMDSSDRCPNSPRGAVVNEFGCTLVAEPASEPVKAEVPAVMNVRLEVNFTTDSSVVGASYFSEIERVAEYLNANPNATVVIEGHTDDRGTEKYNQWLSARRAEAVAGVLEKRFGIVSERISSKGLGETSPLVANDSPENMAINRRVIAVISQ